MGITERKSGFTIVELLIVIVVIAILAAISIVAYTGIQSRARSSAITQELKQIDKSFRLWAAEESFARWPPDTLAGGGTNISQMINSTTPPFASLKSYLQKNPSVNGIGTDAWFYDQDDYDNGGVSAGYNYCIANPAFVQCKGDEKTECSANEGAKLTGVNVIIRYLPQSDEAIAKRVNDAFDSGETNTTWTNCGKIRWYDGGGGNFMIVYALSYTKAYAS